MTHCGFSTCGARLGSPLLQLRRISAWTALAFALALPACQREPVPEIMLQTGQGRIHRFSAVAGYAQYLEQAGRGDTLRIVVASYPIRCDEYLPPPEGEALITVTITAQPGELVAPAKYPWNGQTPVGEGEADSPLEPEERSALPFVRLSADARALPPGGRLSLLAFDKRPHGLVSGEFQFSDTSQGETAHAALFGPFRVPLCALSLDPLRPETVDPESEDGTRGH